MNQINLRPKYILPKSQMTINTLLTGTLLFDKEDRQTQNYKLNFSHQDFSVQIKHNYLLSINFYELDLQDIQWVISYHIIAQNIQFRGITTLNHVSISQYKRKRVRLLYAKMNTLYFYEGHLASKENKYTLRSSLLNSQKIIDLSNIQIGDEVLFISEDLAANEKAGLFIICTRKSHFYALKGNSEIYELIDLNPLQGLHKIFSSITKIFSQKNTLSTLGFDSQIVSYISLKKPQQKQEYFKIIVLRNFDAETRLISLPIVPGQKCKREIILTNQVNIESKVRQVLQVTENDKMRLMSSQMHRLSEVEISILLMVQRSSVLGENCYIVSMTYKFQKGEIIAASVLAVDMLGVKDIEFRKVPQVSEIIIKVQHNDRVTLKHAQMDTLRIIDDSNYPIPGPTMLCESTINEKLLILSPFQVLYINMREHAPMMEDGSQIMQNMEEQQLYQVIGEKQRQFSERLSSINEIHNNLMDSSKKLKNYHKENKRQQMKKIVADLLEEIGNKIQQVTLANSENLDIEEIISLYLTVMMYKSLLEQEEILNMGKIDFRDLRTNDFSEISSLLKVFEREIKMLGKFVDLWISVVQEGFRSKDWFERNDQVRELLSDLINEKFSHIINDVLEKHLPSMSQQSQVEFQETVLLRLSLNDLLLQFIKSTSGIIRLERSVSRLIIKFLHNKQQLKHNAMDVAHFDILTILYFEQGIVSGSQLKIAFRIFLQQKGKGLIDRFVDSFVQQFIQRIKDNQKMHQNAKNFSNLITIFADHQELVKNAINNSDSNLFILTALKYGQRQMIKNEVQSVSQTMRKKKNRKKLKLVISEGQQQMMDEE